MAESNLPDIVPFVRSAALLLAFFIVVACGRKTWLSADRIATFAFGFVFLLVPQFAIDFQVRDKSKLDKIHYQMLQFFGLSLIGSVIFRFLARESRDGTIHIAIMISRLFSTSILLIITGFCHYWEGAYKTFNSQHLSFSILGILLWLSGHLWHTARSDDFSTYPQFNVPLNMHLQIDALLTMLAGITEMIFPLFTASFFTSQTSFDFLHLHFARMIGVQAFGSGILSLLAPGFLHDRDKRSIFVERILVVILGLLILLWQTGLFKFYTRHNFIYLGCGAGPVLINAIFGYFSSSLKYVKSKSK